MALSLSTSTFLRPPPLLSTRKLCKPPQRWIITSRKKAEEPSADKSIHPPFYEDAKVFCNGEHVLTVAGTQKEYVVDVWSGNHPFYLGSRSQTLVDDDQVSKFRKRYGSITQFMEIPVLKGEIIIPPRRKRVGKDGKKK